VGLAAFVTLGLAQLLSAYAGGVLFVAPTGNDANTCLSMSSACKTIASAVSKASTGDTIIIAAGTYTEGVGIDKNLTLIGFGANATIINQGQIAVSNATVHIYDLAITHGDNDSGGGFFNNGGDVTLGYVSVLSNHANYGGGILNQMGRLSLDHTTVGGNRAISYGGGIYNNAGSVLLSHSTIVSNSACNTACRVSLTF
jgi:hypothetical protein